jgi:predicted DNA-binding protein with PD1-like motif
MRARLLNYSEGSRTWAIFFGAGEEALAGLRAFVRAHELEAARVTVVGGLSSARLVHPAGADGDRAELVVREQVEVLALSAVFAAEPDGPAVRVQAVLARSDGSTLGGQLLEARASPALELVIEEQPRYLRRRVDRDSGLPLIAAADG